MRPSKIGARAGLALTLALATPAFADPAPVVAAERAFAADGLGLGVQGAFLKHAAPDGIVFAPEPLLARAVYGQLRPKGKPPLKAVPVKAVAPPG